MEGQSVVIVGAASGLGLTSVKMMIERGVERIGLIDKNEDALGNVVEGLRGTNCEIAMAAGDISTAHTAHALFGTIVERFGRVHSLVNCAAVYPRKAILEITDEEWDQENGVNVKGTYHMMVAAVTHMKQFVNPPRIAGRIVNISSVDAFKAHPQNAHYAATKAAVVSLTRSFAHAFAAEQILINSVAPAGMATEKAKSQGFLPELAAANPLQRAAEPKEIAEFVLMLASSRNTYMTGENVIVSGGYIYA